MRNRRMLEIHRPRYTVKVDKMVVSPEVLERFKENSVVKLITIGPDLSRHSFDPTTNTLQDLKKRYKGQTWMTVPFRVIQKANAVPKFLLLTNEAPKRLIDGYAVVSKRDVRTALPNLKRASLSKVESAAINTIEGTIKRYCAMLSDNVYNVKVEHGEDMFEKEVIATSKADLQYQILSSMPFMDSEFDNDVIQNFQNLK